MLVGLVEANGTSPKVYISQRVTPKDQTSVLKLKWKSLKDSGAILEQSVFREEGVPFDWEASSSGDIDGGRVGHLRLATQPEVGDLDIYMGKEEDTLWQRGPLSGGCSSRQDRGG